MAGVARRGPGPVLRRRSLAVILAGMAVLAGAPPSRVFAQPDGISDRLRAHVEFLADAHLRGRLPGTPGYDLASLYVANQFRAMGLAPAGPDGGWFQPVPMRAATTVPGSVALSVVRSGQRHTLDFPRDFYRPPDLVHEHSAVTAPMAFVGYGVEAPALGHRDYAEIDVTGKVAVMLAGYPEALAGEAGAHFGSRQHKLETAAAHGAVGAIVIFTPLNEAVTDWGALARQVDSPAMGSIRPGGGIDGAAGGLRGVATIHYEAAGVLFEGSGHALSTLLEADREGRGIPVFAMAGNVELTQRSRHQPMRSANVVAMVPGTDPVLARDLVVYVAHLDHIGVRPGPDGELQVHGGALDNAAGVAVMLEAARRLKAQPARRSVVFLAATAEEAGLVGSNWYARHPSPAGHRVAAVINLDMPVLLYDFTAVVAWGGERSSLGDAVAVAAAEIGVAVTEDPFPALNIFTRSDHYPFVRRGVPAVFLAPGPGVAGGTNRAIYRQFMRHDYHAPGDHADQAIDYGAAARFTRLAWRVGDIVAGQSARPRWRDGDFFGETFKR